MAHKKPDELKRIMKRFRLDPKTVKYLAARSKQTGETMTSFVEAAILKDKEIYEAAQETSFRASEVK